MIPGHKHLVFEEGLQSAWLYETLNPHVDELVVAGITTSRGQKSDKHDAYGLAEKLRVGNLDKQIVCRQCIPSAELGLSDALFQEALYGAQSPEESLDGTRPDSRSLDSIYLPHLASHLQHSAPAQSIDESLGLGFRTARLDQAHFLNECRAVGIRRQCAP